MVLGILTLSRLSSPVNQSPDPNLLLLVADKLQVSEKKPIYPFMVNLT